MKGFLLYIVAIVLVAICIIPCMIYDTVYSIVKKCVNNFYQTMAIAIDQFGNVAGQYLWNVIFIKKESVDKFGDPRETMSSVFGKNKASNMLTSLGAWIAKDLDEIQPDHVENAIEKNN